MRDATDEGATSMATTTHYDLELDARGLKCPLQMVRTGQAISEIPVGGVLKVVTTDPACRSDLRAWARSTRHEVVAVEESGGELTHYIRRTS